MPTLLTTQELPLCIVQNGSCFGLSFQKLGSFKLFMLSQQPFRQLQAHTLFLQLCIKHRYPQLKPHLRNLKGNSSHFEPTPVSIHKDQNQDQHFIDWTSPLFSHHIFSTSVSTVRDYRSIDRISSAVKLFYFQVSFSWYSSPFLRLAFQLSFTLSTLSPSL
jgi:hypothetical protein